MKQLPHSLRSLPSEGTFNGFGRPGAADMAVCFDLENVHFDYAGVPAVSAASLRIRAGERVALVGANGSGKSTLLRLLHGLLVPAAGSLDAVPRSRQAMLFQYPHMLRLSVESNVAVGLWLRGCRWRQAIAGAREALAHVGMADLARRNARTLSGGQRQRLALAQAWALRPEVLLLDEPTASLDPHAKRDVEALMQAFTQPVDGSRPGMTIIFSSHNLAQVKRLASRVVYLERGRILTDLPVDDFFSGPLPEPTASFVKGELL